MFVYANAITGYDLRFSTWLTKVGEREKKPRRKLNLVNKIPNRTQTKWLIKKKKSPRKRWRCTKNRDRKIKFSFFDFIWFLFWTFIDIVFILGTFRWHTFFSCRLYHTFYHTIQSLILINNQTSIFHWNKMLAIQLIALQALIRYSVFQRFIVSKENLVNWLTKKKSLKLIKRRRRSITTGCTLLRR